MHRTSQNFSSKPTAKPHRATEIRSSAPKDSAKTAVTPPILDQRRDLMIQRLGMGPEFVDGRSIRCYTVFQGTVNAATAPSVGPFGSSKQHAGSGVFEIIPAITELTAL